jgi:hypothetical protein
LNRLETLSEVLELIVAHVERVDEIDEVCGVGEDAIREAASDAEPEDGRGL